MFRDADDLVDQARRYLSDDAMRKRLAVSAGERYRTELAPDLQFTRVFSKILAESRHPARSVPEPAGGAMFYESMGRSRGIAFLHALHRGSPMGALREIFTKWSVRLNYWRGFAAGIMDTLGNRMRRA